jgi:orotate phosphoribosyltransferase
MNDYQSDFLELCIENEILLFGEFTLKSGRISPYFFNAGRFDNGLLLSQLASSYARLISDNLGSDIMLYGPAYKGIPLAAATAVQMSEKQNINVPYAFNRKEAKDHGEGGNIVGAPLSGKVVVIDDVITAGTSVNESAEIIKSAGAELHAIVIALDRQEIADGDILSAVKKVEDRYGAPVLSLIKLENLVEYIRNSVKFEKYFDSIDAYRTRYGLK